MHFTSNDGSQSTFVYQPTLDMLELKKTKVLIVFLVGNQREYIILSLSHDILVFTQKTLVVEQDNYATKIVNGYIVYDLDPWPRNFTNNFRFKNCLLGVKNSKKYR